MELNIKKFIGSCVLITFAILTLYTSTVFSAVPQIINYQGSLSDANGNPVNATLNITFTLYDDAVAGTTLFQSTQSVTVTNGLFSIQLEADDLSGGPLDPSLFENPVFLGIQVDADAEMTPRQAITAVGYALRAKTVESDTLNSLSCAAGEIPKFNMGDWACATDDSNTGDITGVTAGAGLTGGGVSGDINIAADTNVLQSRVSGSCPAGQSIRVINANGTVTCEVDTDTNTTYSVGSGLALNGTTFSIPAAGVNATHIAPNAVGTSEVINNSLTGSDIANGSITDVDINDEAGGDFSGGNQGFSLTALDSTVRFVSISAPTPGMVMVNASGTFQFNAIVQSGASCSITTSIILDLDHTIRGQGIGNTVSFMPFAGTRGFNVPSGITTFRLVCRELSGSVIIQDSHITAIFVPTIY